ncbi:MAG: AAA family ATPase [Actinomycetaceae bacterium]|nr:AAA family ATPase [Actinomycetaceae bacterium]
MSIELTPEFRRALDLLNDGRNLFLTGKAGTGKSTLIRHYMEGTDRNVIVAAPTGIAALNVDGYTLHRLFSFPVGVTPDDIRAGRVKPARFSRTIGKLDTLIIDEVSMVRADLFDCVVAALERYGPEPTKPFGGVQMVLVGDLYQLPPVVVDSEAEYFRTVYDSPYFFSANAYDRAAFPTVQLTKVFRQLGDAALTDMLNAIRDGRMTTAINRRLNRQTDAEFVAPEGEFWLTLAGTNRIAHSRNKQHLALLEGEEFCSVAERTGTGDAFDAPTADELTFKVGAQIMLLNNDPSDRWVNGSIGRIIDVDVDEGDYLVTAELRDGSTVTIEPHTWEITRPVVSGGNLVHEVIGTFRQLPFKLAWAITIHKSQGQTLQRAVIDLTGGTFATGQLYVALSRCVSLDGLVLKRHVEPRHVKVDYRVRRFLAETAPTRTTDTCVLSSLVVGEADGFIRPIEIAIEFENGTVFTSLVNPTRDIGDAATRYGLSAADLQLAPTLAQLWPVIEERIAGHAIIALDGDNAVGVLDTELKRHGIIAPFENFINIDPADLTPEESEEQNDSDVRARAHSLRRVFARITPDESAVPYEPVEQPRHAYFLTRHLETLDADSHAASATLSRLWAGDGALPEPDGDEDTIAAILSEKLRGQRLAPRTEEILSAFNDHFGVEVEFASAESQLPIDQVLNEGTRVCFTGTVDYRGKCWERADMEDVARQSGLSPVANVTKTRCDVLIAADVTTMSGKAKKAAKWGKPVYSAQEFLAWAGK